MSFGLRAAYKSLGGMSWDDWSIIHSHRGEVPATAEADSSAQPSVA